MYYQLTLQFATSEIDDAKKVLELAKELDLKRAGLEEKLPEPETGGAYNSKSQRLGANGRTGSGTCKART